MLIGSQLLGESNLAKLNGPNHLKSSNIGNYCTSELQGNVSEQESKTLEEKYNELKVKYKELVETNARLKVVSKILS